MLPAQRLRPEPIISQQRVEQEYEPEVIQQQNQQFKRYALPVNFFLPQAYRS